MRHLDLETLQKRVELSVESPLGALRLVAADDALVGVHLPGDPAEQDPRAAAPGRSVSRHPVLEEARAQLRAWFAGRRTTFDLPLRLEGTPFQLSVWRALLDIPYGQTTSYRDLAVLVGRPSAIRAVGAANGRNPLPIIVPCHRVIGSSGALTGYAGGVERKRWLLEHEMGVARTARRVFD